MGLRLNLSEQPEVAIVAVTHALAAQIFYLGADAHVVGIQPIKTDLAGHADGDRGYARDRLAEAVSLDMTGYWRPTVRSYLGRVTKARILEVVCEGVSGEAAERMADMKKVDMAEAAQQLLSATDWRRTRSP